MNLAQLIDPDRLEGPDPLARRRAPAAPLGIVTHSEGVTREARAVAIQADEPLDGNRNSAGVTDACREYLGSAITPFTSLDAIAGALSDRYMRSTVNSALIALHERGDLVRNGPPGARHYGISAKGREKLKRPEE